MNKRSIIVLIFFAAILPLKALGGSVSAADNADTSKIQAVNSQNAASTSPFGRAGSLSTHNSTAGEAYTFQSLSWCNTIDDSREDTFAGAFVEAYNQKRTKIILQLSASVEIAPAARILIFPFHYFL